MDEKEFLENIARELTLEYKDSQAPECFSCFQKVRYMVPMSDGIKLETFVYLPDGPCQSYPVILQRTCYPFWDRTMQVHGEELAKRGYAFVYQYCRGQNGSEGKWEPNVHERKDGIDTVDWIIKQPWAGKIGVWGRSYGALIGWAMADAVSGKVASMFLGVYGTDRFASAYQKGCFRHDVLTSWTMENAGFSIYADYMESCRYMPQAEVDEKLWGKRIDWYRDYIFNDKISDTYWQQGWWKQLREIPSKVEIPLYIVSGWYDHHHGSSMLTWKRLNKKSKDHSWLEVTGLNHMGFPCMQGRKTDNDKKDEIKKMLAWFRLTLVEGKLPKKQARFYEIGADSWYETEDFPKASDEQIMVFYLEAGEEKSLSAQKPLADTSADYVYNPENPVMTHGAESLLRTREEIGSLLQPQPGYRPDVLSFTSKPLDKGCRIFGKIKVKLWVISDCEDTAFTAKLIEVRPNGEAYNIRSSITTILSGRNGGNYVPGTPVQVEIEMWDIFYRVEAGCCLRLDISSSDFPQYHIHSNYKGPWALQSRYKKASQTILCGNSFPSELVIPLLFTDTCK